MLVQTKGVNRFEIQTGNLMEQTNLLDIDDFLNYRS